MSYNNNRYGGNNYNSQNNDNENRDPIFFYVVERTGKPGASIGLFGSKNDQYPGWNSFPIGTLQEFYDAMIRGGFKPTDTLKLRLDEPKNRNSKVAFQIKFVIPNETQIQGQYQDNYHQGQQQQQQPVPQQQQVQQPVYQQQQQQQVYQQPYQEPQPMQQQQQAYPQQPVYQQPVPQQPMQQQPLPQQLQQPMPQPVYPAGPASNNGQRRY